jgi:hypothetical protein
MSCAHRFVGMRRDDDAAHHGVRIKCGENSIQRSVAC